MVRVPVGLLLVSFVGSACSETTRIYSDPPGATVWINGSALGATPVKVSGRKGRLPRAGRVPQAAAVCGP